MALTQLQYDAAAGKQTTLANIEALLTVYPEITPEPVSISEITALLNGIAQQQATFTDLRIMDTVNDALADCYEDIKDRLNALISTVAEEFEAIGEVLDTPVSLTATPGNTQIVLTWTEHPRHGVTYKVYMSVNADHSDEYLIHSETTLLTKTKTGLVNGTPYYFRMKVTADGYDDSTYATASATPAP